MSSELGDTEPDSGRGFDPFGKPREANWEDVPDTLDDDLNGDNITTRGFTAHEHLNGTDLIHMNGRAYDYNLGRFLSVDPVIQFPSNSQSLNPYSYILNNPMSGTDPTGYCVAETGEEGCTTSDETTGRQRSGEGPAPEGDNGQRSTPSGNQEPPDSKNTPDDRRDQSGQRNDEDEELPELPSITVTATTTAIPYSGFGAGDIANGLGNLISDAAKVFRLTPAGAGILSLGPAGTACAQPADVCIAQGLEPPPLTGLRQPTLNEEVSDDSNEDIERNPNQDKKLTDGDIDTLEEAGFDAEDLKGGKRTGQWDLFKDKQGNVYVKPKNGSGPGDPLGINLKDLRGGG